MRELSISEYDVVSGGFTEAQCESGFATAGGLAGLALGRSVPAGAFGMGLGAKAGSWLCPSITPSQDNNNNNNGGEDGDE